MSGTVSPNQESPGAASSGSSSSVRFKTCHDLEMFLFLLGKPSIFEPRIGMKDWEEAADSLRKTFPELKGLTGRTVRDRTLREIKQFKANDNKSRRKSGVEEEYQQKDGLLGELASRLEATECVQQQKKAKKTADERNGVSLREAALVELRHKKQRKRSCADSDGSDDSSLSGTDDGEEKEQPAKEQPATRKKVKKTSGSTNIAEGLLDWLQAKTKAETELKNRELKLREMELELRKAQQQ